jgi:citronellol/citronellal dehydrogenase
MPHSPQDRRSAVFAPDVLSGQVALITGGGTGLGRGAALELARCGATVVIAGRRENVLAQAAAEVAAAGGGPARGDSVAGDVRDPDEAERIVATVLERHGRLDTLVNNAGGQYFAPAESIADKGWKAVWRLNVNGTVHMSRVALQRAMAPAGAGMIVNVTLSPHHGMPGMAHSAAARAAVEALTRELAREGQAHGVAVTAVAAGHFGTEATDKYPEAVRAGAALSVPLGRLGRVEEHAWLIALLASPLGRALSGSVITIDGARDNWFGPWPPPTLADESGVVPTEARRTTEEPRG